MVERLNSPGGQRFSYCLIFPALRLTSGWLAAARGADMYATSPEDFEAVTFPRDRALIVARVCGGILKRA